MPELKIAVYIKDTGTPKGRGVFAARHIEEGEVIETCHMIQFETSFDELAPELQRMVFDWEILAGVEGVAAMALGCGSLYNHNNPANARYMAGPDGKTLIITAARRIEQDEEVTINYNDSGGEPYSTEDTWFIANGIEVYSS